MTAIRKEQDAYGDALLAKVHGDDLAEAVIERDDGYVDIDHIDYLSPFGKWSPTERAAAAKAHGRVLDVGCGPGRLARYLQDRGHVVVGIDVSPGAVQAARELGVRDVRLLGAAQVSATDGPFDTIAMFGNNLGLLRDARHAPWLLRRFARLTPPQGRILGVTRDPYQTEDPKHLAYQERNRERGRMSGQVRLRIRRHHKATPWFDYLFLSRRELESIAGRSGWQIGEVFEDRSPQYAVMLTKTP